MKKALILCVVCAVITVIVVAFGLVKNTARSVEQSPSESKPVKPDSKSLVRLLQDARIVAFNSWSVEEGDEDKKLTYTVQAFDQDPKYEGAGVKLSIFDENGKVIYEDYFSAVERIYSSYALRKGPPQLIVEVNYGGSASFLEMLDYQNGKIVDLMEATKSNDFAVNAEVRPQFRTSVTPALEPDQVMLTGGVGLASSVEKYTDVYRYKDGAYRYVGKFSTREVDDYAEKLLTEGSSNKKPQGK